MAVILTTRIGLVVDMEAVGRRRGRHLSHPAFDVHIVSWAVLIEFEEAVRICCWVGRVPLHLAVSSHGRDLRCKSVLVNSRLNLRLSLSSCESSQKCRKSKGFVHRKFNYYNSRYGLTFICMLIRSTYPAHLPLRLRPY